MYICRNKLVYYHIVKDFERIYFSLLKCKNNYTKWGKLHHSSINSKNSIIICFSCLNIWIFEEKLLFLHKVIHI